jgi:hypothetical protein
MSHQNNSTVADELSEQERSMFELNAKSHGRSPGEHLKAILFPSRRPSKQVVSKIGIKKGKKRLNVITA